MALIRSCKFLRLYESGKNLFNPRKFKTACCVCSSKNFVTTTSSDKSSHTLDDLLKRLNNKVRRLKRISIRDMERILEDIRINKSATSSQSLLVIKCCECLVPDLAPEALPVFRTKMVQKVWKTLSELNIPMDISHYNALLRIYIENEYKFSPTVFLSDLQAKGLEPNYLTYQGIISGFCQQGDISGALKILEFMQEKQVSVNEKVFNALIMGHSKCNDVKSAAGILEIMTQVGLHPSADTYTTLLCGFARVGDMKSIERFIEQSEHENISLLDKDFLEVIYTLAVNGHEAKVDELLPRLKKNFEYIYDVINFSIRLINRRQELTALKLLRTMHQEIRMSDESGEECKAKSEKEVIDIFKLMGDFNMAPNDKTLREYVIPKILKNDDYESVINTLCSCGVSLRRALAESAVVAISNNHLVKAAEIMNHYETLYIPGSLKNGPTKTPHHSNDFTSYIKNIRSIFDNLDKEEIMKVRKHETEGEKESEETSGESKMIELYLSEDRPDDALEMLQALREKDPEFVLDKVKTVKIVQSLVNADRIDEAIKFFEQNKYNAKKTQGKNLSILQDTCRCLLNSLAEKGKVEELNKLFEALVANGYLSPDYVLLAPLIKVHLIKNDVKAAVEKFVKICRKYRVTPCKNEIVSFIIKSEDAVNLVRISELCTEIHGNYNSIYDLVSTFAECNRTSQPKITLETPDFERRQDCINIGSDQYPSESMLKALGGLINATIKLNQIDRANIYHTLLKLLT